MVGLFGCHTGGNVADLFYQTFHGVNKPVDPVTRIVCEKPPGKPHEVRIE